MATTTRFTFVGRRHNCDKQETRELGTTQSFRTFQHFQFIWYILSIDIYTMGFDYMSSAYQRRIDYISSHHNELKMSTSQDQIDILGGSIDLSATSDVARKKSLSQLDHELMTGCGTIAEVVESETKGNGAFRG